MLFKSKKRTGFTLLEVLIVSGIIAAVIGAITVLYVVGLKSWSAGSDRIELRESLNQGIDAMVRDLRHAKDITSFRESSVTFTAVDFESTTTPPPDATYRYYLYNASDSEPNPPYTASSYMLMRSKNDTNYGVGRVIARNIDQPTGRPFSRNGDLISIDLQGSKEGQTIGLRSKVKIRN